MTAETILLSVAGGTLIGLASVGLMLFNGKVAGVSGILGSLLGRFNPDTLWRAAFALGLLVGGVILRFAYPQTLASTLDRSFVLVVIAGLLVGFGARLGSGCTSGHGVCGVSRLSRRSLIATAVFTVSGVVATTLITRVFGGTL